jgi:O-antigen ligase
MLGLVAFPDYAPFYNLGELSLLKIVGILTCIYAIIINFSGISSFSFLNQPQKKLFFIYFLSGIILITIFGMDMDIYNFKSYLSYLKYFSFLSLFITFNTFVRSIDKANKVVWIILLCLLINCHEAIAQANYVKGHYRAVGFFNDPNYFGSALLIGIGLAIAIMDTAQKRSIQIIGGGILLIYLFTILKTMSRGVIVALSFMFLTYVLKSKIYQLNTRKKILIVLILILGCMIIIKKSGRELFFIDQRIQDTKIVENAEDREGTSGSTTDRYTILITGLKMIQENPIFGVGINMFKRKMINYVEDYSELGRRYVAHNTYLEVAAEQGLILFVIFLAMLFYTLRDLIRIEQKTLDSENNKLHTISYGTQIGFIGYLVSIAFVSSETDNFLWILIFFTMALNTIDLEESNKQLLDSKILLSKGRPNNMKVENYYG